MIGGVDIHAHVLPGIDDGPPDLDRALAMARAAADAGTATIAATPHLRSDFPDVHVGELSQRCDAMREAIAREGIALELVSGAEVSLPWALEASAEDLRLSSYGQRGSDLLIETPATGVGGLAELIYELRLRGYRVTLAHPERSASFQSDPAQLEELVRQGVLLQVNAASLRRDRRGSQLRRLAGHLCSVGVAHAIGSDAHRGSSWRPVTDFSAAADEAAAFVGPARAQWLTRDAPAAILAGDQLPQPPVIETRGRFGRLLGRW